MRGTCRVPWAMGSERRLDQRGDGRGRSPTWQEGGERGAGGAG